MQYDKNVAQYKKLVMVIYNFENNFKVSHDKNFQPIDLDERIYTLANFCKIYINVAATFQYKLLKKLVIVSLFLVIQT